MTRRIIAVAVASMLSACATSSSTTDASNSSANPNAEVRTDAPTTSDGQIADCTSLRTADRGSSADPDAPKSTNSDDDGYTPPLVAKGPVATVDGEPLPPREFHEVVRKNLPQSLGSKTPLMRKRIIRNTVQTAVRNRLVERAVAGDEVAVSRTRLQDAYREYKNSFPGDEIFRQFLTSRGLTPNDVEVDICHDLQFRELLRKEYDLSVSSDEIASYYESNRSSFSQPARVKTRQIFIRAPESAGAKKRKAAYEQAVQFAKRVQDGETTLQKIARTSGPSKWRIEFGTFGYGTREELAAPLRKPAFRLKPGQVSKPVPTQKGFFVLEVVGRKSSKTERLDDVRDEIRQKLRSKKMKDAKRTFFERAEADAGVEYHYDNVALRESAAAGKKRQLEMPVPGGSGP